MYVMSYLDSVNITIVTCVWHTFFFEISSKCFFKKKTKLSPKSYWIALQGFPVDELNLDGLKDQNLRLLAGHMCGSCVLVENFSLKNPGFDRFSLRILAYFVKKVDKLRRWV